jgi:hypothetical protein
MTTINGLGNDTIFAKDGVTENVTGGAGTDKATLDPSQDRPDSIENQAF